MLEGTEGAAGESATAPEVPDQPTPLEQPDAPAAREPDPAAGTSDPGTPAPQSAADWRTAIADVDPEDLLKDRRIGGIVGERARRQAEKLAEEKAEEIVARRLAEMEQRQREERLVALAEADDLYSLGKTLKDEVLTKRQQQQRAAQTQNQITQFWLESADPLLLSTLDDLEDDTARTPIRAKYEKGEYGADPVAARKAYLKDVMEAYASVKLKKLEKELRTKWERTELPALVKEKLGIDMELEPSPDEGGGAGRGGSNGVLTPEKYASMSYEDRQALKLSNPDLIDKMIRRYSGMGA